MAFRMEAQSTEAHRPVSADDLRQVFEAAVCEIHQADKSANQKLEYRAPIVPRAKVLGISQASAEKRALSDAARALALLWKVKADNERLRGNRVGLETALQRF
jgi:hypothetical protein